jgi:hypothetical protein
MYRDSTISQLSVDNTFPGWEADELLQHIFRRDVSKHTHTLHTSKQYFYDSVCTCASVCRHCCMLSVDLLCFAVAVGTNIALLLVCSWTKTFVQLQDDDRIKRSAL